METHEIELSVEQKREGKLRVRMWCLLALYALTLLGGLIVVFKTVMIALGAIIPLVLYTLVLCTWRFVDVEQKYAIEAGDLIIYRKFGNSKPKKLIEVKIKTAELIAPLEQCTDVLSRIKQRNVYNALPSQKCDNAYAIIYELDGVKKAVLIQVIPRTLRGLKYYNESVVMRELV